MARRKSDYDVERFELFVRDLLAYSFGTVRGLTEFANLVAFDEHDGAGNLLLCGNAVEIFAHSAQYKALIG